MERENGRWNPVWYAAAGLALAGALQFSTPRQVEVRGRIALPQVQEVRAEAVCVADGIPFPKDKGPGGVQVADGIPFPKDKGPGGVRVA